MKIKAYAKFNLNLNILPIKLTNGLYKVKFINCQINLADELEIKKNNCLTIQSNLINLPLDSKNLVYQVAQLLNVSPLIKITKNIPLFGGLGGGSSDAASTMKSLITLYRLPISSLQLKILANHLGKDVCYLIKGGLCQISGDGSLVKKLFYKLPTLFMIIIYPQQTKPSTAFMYQHLNKTKIGQNLNHFNQLNKALKENNKEAIVAHLFNDFENLAFQICPELHLIKKDLLINGARKTILLGSGLGIAGIFFSKKNQNLAFKKLKLKYTKILKSKTIH